MGNGIKTMSQVNFTDMSDSNLERTLYDYSEARSGDIADLTRAAAIRIGVLSARVKQLETDKGDDRK